MLNVAPPKCSYTTEQESAENSSEFLQKLLWAFACANNCVNPLLYQMTGQSSRWGLCCTNYKVMSYLCVLLGEAGTPWGCTEGRSDPARPLLQHTVRRGWEVSPPSCKSRLLITLFIIYVQYVILYIYKILNVYSYMVYDTYMSLYDKIYCKVK